MSAKRENRSTGVGIMYPFYPLGFVFAVLVFALVTPRMGLAGSLYVLADSRRDHPVP